MGKSLISWLELAFITEKLIFLLLVKDDLELLNVWNVTFAQASTSIARNNILAFND